ncbi:MAG: hypothetical protein LCH95_17190 [Proteobacteria bacterium]|nr:hypothetical protein [Pseudomonadota bacterium]
MKAVLLFALLGLTSCGPSIEELRERAPAFSMTVPVPWEQLSTCLKGQALAYTIVDLPVASERRTEIVLQFTGAYGPITTGSFEVQGLGDASTKVSYKSIKNLGLGGKPGALQREWVEKCGAAAR